VGGRGGGTAGSSAKPGVGTRRDRRGGGGGDPEGKGRLGETHSFLARDMYKTH
jgi:hypothetical protein